MGRVRTALSRHDGLAQAAVVVGAAGAYEAMRMAARPDWAAALGHAREVGGWERMTGLAWEAPLQRLLLEAPPLVQAMDAFYLSAHFAVTGVFFLWLYRRSRPAFRLFRNGFLIGTALALAVAWCFPTAPPRAAGLGLVDTLRRFSDIDIGSPGSAGLSDPVAAIPSLHAGWAFGVAAGVVLLGRSAASRWGAVLYAALVVVTILATGNHFVVDVLAGGLVMAIGFALARLPARALARPVAHAASLIARSAQALLPGSVRVVSSTLRRGVEQPGSSPGS